MLPTPAMFASSIKGTAANSGGVVLALQRLQTRPYGVGCM